MPSVRVSRLSFAHSDAAPLFDQASFHLSAGFTGLVGANGAGKSTLLRLLLGELRPASGAVERDPRGGVALLCPQSVEALDAAVRSFAASWDAGPARLRGELGLDEEQLARWPSLSPGERKRWQLGAALAAEPDVLLLDEPTNHLDAEGRELLMRALRRFRGVGVVVSHDRALLDALTASTLRVHRGDARIWPGAYSEAREQWEAETAARREEHAAATSEQRRIERQLRETERRRAAASASRSAGKRMKDRYDSDARTLLADSRAERAEQGLGRRVGTLRRAAASAADAVEAIEIEREHGGVVWAGFERAARPILLRRDAGPLLAGERALFTTPALTLRRDARIHVAGPNGCGKTTLLRALLASAELPPDKVLFLPQELTAAQAAAALADVRALPPPERSRALSFVSALGSDPDRLLASAQPSPGEARKLLLARGLGQSAWILVLDEPTNHLDLPSIERLESALRGYPGAVLLVTHDKRLAKACCSEDWRVDDYSRQ
jgi:ATPase subunit of ABC transporter with duplicated ATPase domains